jgi:transposase
MYVDTAKIKRGSKTYTRNLLRTSYREDGKVKHKTVLNLSICSQEEITAIKLALKHKGKLTALASIKDVKTILGKSIGAVWTMKVIAERVKVSKALGNSAEAKLALLQVIARVIDQGSRLSAVRFAKRHAVCEILGITKLDEDDLYENLAWLASKQENIEKKLFENRFPGKTPTLFLYDVTSSYLEGDNNELANWGYNRDKKKGKKQIVVGLLTGPDGLPVAVRVFEGNTVDTKTVAEQVRILARNFGVKDVTLVGDRGMLKGPQIADLPDDFKYVTAISKPQIRKKLCDKIFQYELFTKKVSEVEEDGVRYVLRCNPIRKGEMAKNRESKFDSIKEFADERTKYLGEHPRASVAKALEKVNAKIKKLTTAKWLCAKEEHRIITLKKDEDALSEESLLDGCYVIKSDVPKEDADAQKLHDRYCDLEMVERAFRTMKTSHLELRPVFVKKKSSTQGHVFVVMLALLLQRELENAITNMNITVQEAIDELEAIRMQEVKLGNATIQNIPTPTVTAKEILKNTSITLPKVLPKITANVHTNEKLQSERKLKKLQAVTC